MAMSINDRINQLLLVDYWLTWRPLYHLDNNLVYYFAHAYTSKHKDIVLKRYILSHTIAVRLIQEYDLILIEPIAMCHLKSTLFGLSGGYEFWKRRDRKFIDKSDAIIVALDIEGWQESVGVQDEIQHALDQGKPVYLLRNDRIARLHV